MTANDGIEGGWGEGYALFKNPKEGKRPTLIEV